MNCCDEIGRAAPHSAPPARVSHATVDFLIRGRGGGSWLPGRLCTCPFLHTALSPLHISRSADFTSSQSREGAGWGRADEGRGVSASRERLRNEDQPNLTFLLFKPIFCPSSQKSGQAAYWQKQL